MGTDRFCVLCGSASARLQLNTRDVAAVMGVIAGRDANDSTSTTAPVPDYRAAMEKPVKGLRVGIPKEYFAEGMDDGFA